MRNTLATLHCLLALCLFATVPVGLADDGEEAVQKTGKLVVMTDDAGKLISATLVSEMKDEWGDALRYELVLNEKTSKQAIELKGKQVVVTGTLAMDDDNLIEQIKAKSIELAKADKADKIPVKKAEPEVEQNDNGDEGDML
jgi:hypothetical protein